MIAVLAEESDHPVVREFFELFKTPWEFYRAGQEYDVLLCSDSRLAECSAKLVLIFGSEQKSFDREYRAETSSQLSVAMLSYQGAQIPIYGNCRTFKVSETSELVEESTRQSVLVRTIVNQQTFVRVGFDLFHEIRHLLTKGQPLAHAGIPTLELHINLLRNLISAAAIPLIEIPPVPAGCSFIACLTHDVDHVGVRNHKLDHTMFGFLYRATLGSVVHLFQGRKSFGQMIKNWLAALSLPLVHLGLAKDFWYQFRHYLKIEDGRPSTFFVIPEKGNPGQNADGSSSPMRAAKYDAATLTDEFNQLQAAGCEIGVHGIDAWRDESKGRAEFARIAGLIDKSELGVRMHWLYFDGQSPATLEAAGFSYDSTIGYNETVGYRAGTSQVFKPFQTTTLLELPMHVMDTSLFYPSHMNLSTATASDVVGGLMDNVAKFGGVLTINWHDRSIAPERLWGEFYIKLMDDLENRGARFLTAAQSTAWFRARRSVKFENVTRDDGGVLVNFSLSQTGENLPALRMRSHKPTNIGGGFSEVVFNGSGTTRIPL